MCCYNKDICDTQEDHVCFRVLYNFAICYIVCPGCRHILLCMFYRYVNASNKDTNTNKTLHIMLHYSFLRMAIVSQWQIECFDIIISWGSTCIDTLKQRYDSTCNILLMKMKNYDKKFDFFSLVLFTFNLIHLVKIFIFLATHLCFQILNKGKQLYIFISWYKNINFCLNDLFITHILKYVTHDRWSKA